MDPKQGGDLGWEKSTYKVTYTSIVWSHDKSKIFCHHFHKAQGPQI